MLSAIGVLSELLKVHHMFLANHIHSHLKWVFAGIRDLVEIRYPQSMSTMRLTA